MGFDVKMDIVPPMEIAWSTRSMRTLLRAREPTSASRRWNWVRNRLVAETGLEKPHGSERDLSSGAVPGEYENRASVGG